MSNALTIGQVADQAGVRADTIRYYEKRGLIPKPLRRPSGYRSFTEETIRRIRFIKRAQELGFTLEEVGQLLSLRESPEAGRIHVEPIAARKMRVIDEKIADLRAIRGALQRLMDGCNGRVPRIECPIIESLEGTGDR